ncbi:hypothetical protein ACQEU3_30965 [Spirillospora sp. CA-253888]
MPPANSPRSAPPPGRDRARGAGQHGQSGTGRPSSASARSTAWVRSSSPGPGSANTTGVSSRRAASRTRSATRGAGGLDTSTISPVAGSASSAFSAVSADRPLTSGDRSRPPTPSTCETPVPAASSRHITCCAPVPEAATTPTGPGRTALANPRPAPPTTAVPQSGPITIRPRRAAVSFSATSCATGTLSLKIITLSPASSASIASGNTCGPGTDTSATVASARAAADATVRGGASAPVRPAPQPGSGRASRRSSSASRTPSSACSPSARTATTRSAGPAPSGTANPRSASVRRFRSVAIAAIASPTPARPPSLRLTRISVTESW